jgi:hypothetical protein
VRRDRERLLDVLEAIDRIHQHAALDCRAAELDRDMEEGQALGVPWDEVARQLQARR